MRAGLGNQTKTRAANTNIIAMAGTWDVGKGAQSMDAGGWNFASLPSMFVSRCPPVKLYCPAQPRNMHLFSYLFTSCSSLAFYYRNKFVILCVLLFILHL